MIQSTWKSSPLPSLLTLMKSGGTPTTSRSDFYGGDIPFVAIEDMTACNKYLSSTVKTLTCDGLRYSNAWLVPECAILYSIYATLGVPRINLIPVATNQAILALVARPSRMDRGFLYYWLDHARDTVVNANSSQTTQKNLSATIVKTFVVRHPEDVCEQSKIAEVLSTVDRAIEQTEALIAKQQRIKTGLMQDLLTRGIDERGNLRSEQTHKFKDSPLGRIPAGWDIAALGSVAESVTSGSRGWAKYYREDGALFIRIGNLTREHINLRLDDLVFVQPPESAEGLRTAVQAGDLLISVTADLGIIGVIPKGFVEGYVNQHIALARLRPAVVSARFVGWFLSSREGRAQFDRLNESGAKAGLNLPTVRSLLFPRPDVDEQHRITEVIDACVGTVDQHDCSLRKLQALKRGLMQDLLTGKRRVTALLEQREGATP